MQIDFFTFYSKSGNKLCQTQTHLLKHFKISKMSSGPYVWDSENQQRVCARIPDFAIAIQNLCTCLFFARQNCPVLGRCFAYQKSNYKNICLHFTGKMVPLSYTTCIGASTSSTSPVLSPPMPLFEWIFCQRAKWGFANWTFYNLQN